MTVQKDAQQISRRFPSEPFHPPAASTWWTSPFAYPHMYASGNLMSHPPYGSRVFPQVPPVPYQLNQSGFSGSAHQFNVNNTWNAAPREGQFTLYHQCKRSSVQMRCQIDFRLPFITSCVLALGGPAYWYPYAPSGYTHFQQHPNQGFFYFFSLG